MPDAQSKRVAKRRRRGQNSRDVEKSRRWQEATNWDKR
ncbi:hypothetical protein C356_02703 [Cryptococcus neoformans c45]|nr:hypothetical protein C356_02703 [Cryptococcus neoformans var. grubii c45]